MSNHPWVLIDTSYLAYRAFYAIRGLEFEEIPTGVIFGFFNQLLSICEDPRIRSNRVALCFDSKGSYRQNEYPEYKGNRREKTPEEMKGASILQDQLRLLRKRILPQAGFPCYLQSGLESDDLMAQAARWVEKEYRKEACVIITGDGDLYQCIRSNVHWYDPGRGKYFDPESFREAKGIDATAWGLIKSIAGCSTDNVAGVHRVGELTAIKYLNHNLPKTHKTHQAIQSNEGAKTIARNGSLVVLPHAKTQPFKLREPEYNPDSFFATCERYGLQSHLTPRHTAAWMRFFRGWKDRTQVRKRVATQ